MNLHIEDEENLRSPTAWLKGHIVDLDQKLICKELGADGHYQSVLNV